MSGGNLLWVIVQRVVGVYCGLLYSEWWEFIVGYCAVSGGNLLWVIVQRVVGIFYQSKIP